MRVLIAGASGFLGSNWASQLEELGHDVVRLVRRTPARAGEAQWDPYAGDLDPGLVEEADVVANLAGAPLAHWPWTEPYKRTFMDSRVVTTRLLAERIAQSASPPAFLAQNGVAGYGDRRDEVVTEATPTDGRSFMAEVTRSWEAATAPAREAGARVVVLRTGVVLDRRGGALKLMLPVFRLGAGGAIGDGRQHFATISLQDWLAAATWLAMNEETSGAYNLVGPDTTTNAEFTAELARALQRPAVMRVPGFALRRLGGVAGGELLSSARVEPRRLLEAGYAFAHNDVSERIAAALR